MDINPIMLSRVVENALYEDLGRGDITTNAIFSEEDMGSAYFLAKQDGVVAGLPVARQAFLLLDPDIVWTQRVDEGSKVAKGAVLAEVSGKLRALLGAERVALNFLQRMCGIATQTAQFVEAVAGHAARITDTRKTAPGLRALDKYAVFVGGGVNHRYGLDSAVLIKDNHIAAAGSIARAVGLARSGNSFTVSIEVETETLEQVREALSCGVDIIMLDNMKLSLMAEAVSLVAGRALVEASGGVNLDTVREIAATGVDLISVGRLTHHVQAMDISLELHHKVTRT